MIDLIIKHWCLAQLLATLPLQTSWTGDRSLYLVITWLVPLVSRLLPWNFLGVQNRHLSLDAGAAQNDLSQIKMFLSFRQSKNYKVYIHVREHEWRPNTYLLLCHVSHQYSALQRIEGKRPSTEAISNEHSASGDQNLMNRDSIFSLWGQVRTWGPEELGMTFIPCSQHSIIYSLWWALERKHHPRHSIHGLSPALGIKSYKGTTECVLKFAKQTKRS